MSIYRDYIINEFKIVLMASDLHMMENLHIKFRLDPFSSFDVYFGTDSQVKIRTACLQMNRKLYKTSLRLAPVEGFWAFGPPSCP